MEGLERIIVLAKQVLSQLSYTPKFALAHFIVLLRSWERS